MKSYIILILTIACCLSWQHAEASIGISFVKNCSSQTSNDGEVEVAASGNAEPFTFYWGPGLTTTNKRTGLASGIYSVTVTNSFGCTFVRTANVLRCQSPAPSFYQPIQITNYVISPLTTSGVSNGAVDITVIGGYYGQLPQLYYKWVNTVTGVVVGTGQDATNLPAGKYQVTVTDGCTSASATYKIIACGDIQWSITSKIKNDCDCSSCTFCNSCKDGSIQITSVLGGVGPYIYKWNNIPNNTSTNSGLSVGNYNVTISDLGTGCSTTRDFIVGTATVVVTKTDECSWKATCEGDLVENYTGQIGEEYYYEPSNGSCILKRFCDGKLIEATSGLVEYKIDEQSCTAEFYCGGESVEYIIGEITYSDIILESCTQDKICTIKWPNGIIQSRIVETKYGVQTNTEPNENDCTTKTICKITKFDGSEVVTDITTVSQIFTCRLSEPGESGCKIAQYCKITEEPDYSNQSTWGDSLEEDPYLCSTWPLCPAFLDHLPDSVVYRSDNLALFKQSVSIIPNPFSKYLNILIEQFEKGEKVSIQVFNMLGVETYSDVHTVQNNSIESITLDLGDKGKSGFYNLILVGQTSGFVYRAKIVQVIAEE
jgi:hypothetical protein